MGSPTGFRLTGGFEIVPADYGPVRNSKRKVNKVKPVKIKAGRNLLMNFITHRNLGVAQPVFLFGKVSLVRKDPEVKIRIT